MTEANRRNINKQQITEFLWGYQITKSIFHQLLKNGEDRSSIVKQIYPEPTVGALIFNKKRRFLLVKSPKWFDKYTIPGGHAELGEDLETALIREVKEEVGLDIKVKEFLNWQEAIYSKEFYKPKHFIFFDFYCMTNSTKVKIDGREITDYIWVDPKEASKLDIDSFTSRTIQEYLKFMEKS